MRVVIETGPKSRKAVALAPDWPGLSRGDTTEEAAIDRLRSYVPRYAPVATLAGMKSEYSASMNNIDVVERYAGVGSTDFWGISFAHSNFDRETVSPDALERELALLQACWSVFDDVRSRVSAEMQKGPRGGGRDRDRIVLHTIAAEADWARKLGLQTPQETMLTDEELKAHREAFCAAIRNYHSEGRVARTWPLRFLIRHAAYHTLDHTWEMEDKDLTGKPS